MKLNKLSSITLSKMVKNEYLTKLAKSGIARLVVLSLIVTTAIVSASVLVEPKAEAEDVTKDSIVKSIDEIINANDCMTLKTDGEDIKASAQGQCFAQIKDGVDKILTGVNADIQRSFDVKTLLDKDYKPEDVDAVLDDKSTELTTLKNSLQAGATKTQVSQEITDIKKLKTLSTKIADDKFTDITDDELKISTIYYSPKVASILLLKKISQFDLGDSNEYLQSLMAANIYDQDANPMISGISYLNAGAYFSRNKVKYLNPATEANPMTDVQTCEADGNKLTDTTTKYLALGQYYTVDLKEMCSGIQDGALVSFGARIQSADDSFLVNDLKNIGGLDEVFTYNSHSSVYAGYMTKGVLGSGSRNVELLSVGTKENVDSAISSKASAAIAGAVMAGISVGVLALTAVVAGVSFLKELAPEIKNAGGFSKWFKNRSVVQVEEIGEGVARGMSGAGEAVRGVAGEDEALIQRGRQAYRETIDEGFVSTVFDKIKTSEDVVQICNWMDGYRTARLALKNSAKQLGREIVSFIESNFELQGEALRELRVFESYVTGDSLKDARQYSFNRLSAAVGAPQTSDGCNIFYRLLDSASGQDSYGKLFQNIGGQYTFRLNGENSVTPSNIDLFNLLQDNSNSLLNNSRAYYAYATEQRANIFLEIMYSETGRFFEKDLTASNVDLIMIEDGSFIKNGFFGMCQEHLSRLSTNAASEIELASFSPLLRNLFIAGVSTAAILGIAAGAEEKMTGLTTAKDPFSLSPQFPTMDGFLKDTKNVQATTGEFLSPVAYMSFSELNFAHVTPVIHYKRGSKDAPEQTCDFRADSRLPSSLNYSYLQFGIADVFTSACGDQLKDGDEVWLTSRLENGKVHDKNPDGTPARHFVFKRQSGVFATYITQGDARFAPDTQYLISYTTNFQTFRKLTSEFVSGNKEEFFSDLTTISSAQTDADLEFANLSLDNQIVHSYANSASEQLVSSDINALSSSLFNEHQFVKYNKNDYNYLNTTLTPTKESLYAIFVSSMNKFFETSGEDGQKYYALMTKSYSTLKNLLFSELSLDTRRLAFSANDTDLSDSTLENVTFNCYQEDNKDKMENGKAIVSGSYTSLTCHANREYIGVSQSYYLAAPDSYNSVFFGGTNSEECEANKSKDKQTVSFGKDAASATFYVCLAPSAAEFDKQIIAVNTREDTRGAEKWTEYNLAFVLDTTRTVGETFKEGVTVLEQKVDSTNNDLSQILENFANAYVGEKDLSGDYIYEKVMAAKDYFDGHNSLTDEQISYLTSVGCIEATGIKRPTQLFRIEGYSNQAQITADDAELFSFLGTDTNTLLYGNYDSGDDKNIGN